MGKRVHFIGICGKGMSAVAELMQEKGWSVTGSDAEFYPPVSDYLVRHKVSFVEGYRAENVPQDVDLIVIGKNAKLVPESNDEVRAAFEKGIPVKSFPDILEDLTAATENIVVAGSYGKSTTTALLSWCLVHSGKDPSYFIGEVVRGMDEHAHIGTGGLFVLEGDEYPSSNWDPASKFLHYNPTHVLLTAAAHDHVNIFPTQADFEAPFYALLALMPPQGLLVTSADEPFAKSLAAASKRNCIFYGLHAPEAVWSTRHIEPGERTRFTLTKQGEPVVELTTELLGAHNIENIVAASALLLERNAITPEQLAHAVLSFKGVKRRMELLTQNSSVPVYEGFGSSYDKAKSALRAAKLHYPNRRLVVVFEPHTFSWRSKEMLHWYDDIFKDSSLVLIYHPADQGAQTHSQASHEEIVERVRSAGGNACSVTTPAQTLALLEAEVALNDVILILTSGGLDGMTVSIPELIERKFAK